MPVVKVGDKRIKFPDSMSQEQIRQALSSHFKPEPSRIDKMVAESEDIAQLKKRLASAESAKPMSLPFGGMDTNRGRIKTLQDKIAQRENEIRTIEGIRDKNPELAKMIEETGAGEAALVGAGRGLSTIGRAVGLADPEDEYTKEAMKGLEAEQPVALAAGEIVGESAPFLAAAPLAGAGLATQVGGRTIIPAAKGIKTAAAMQGGLGAAEGYSIAKGKGRSNEDALKMAALGGVIGSVASVGSTLASRSMRKADDVINADDIAPIDKSDAMTPDDIVDLDDSSLEQFFDDPAKFSNMQEEVRRDAFSKLGLEPTVPQVTREPELFQKQVDIFRDASLDNEVRRRLVEQEKILTDLVDGKIDAVGGSAERASSSPIDTIVNKSLELDSEISGLYKAAREATPDAKNIKFSKASEVLKSNAPINSRTDGTVQAMRDQMQAAGFLDDKWRPTGKTSVDAAENLRIFANKLYDGANPLARTFLRDMKDAIDDDVFAVAGQDYYKAARAAKRNFMEGLEAKKGHKFDRRSTSLVRDVLEGSQQPDDLVNKIISRGSKYKTKEVRELKDYLHSGTPEQVAAGTRAWNDIRAAALGEIKKGAFKGAETELGTRTLTRAGLSSALEKIGPQKVDLLFTQNEKSFLRDLARVSELKTPVAGVYASPSKPALQRVENSIKRIIPAIAEWMPSTKHFSDRVDKNAIIKLQKRLDAIEAERAEKLIVDIRKGNRGLISSAAPATVIALPASAEEEKR